MLFAFDLDGTLLSSDGSVSPRVVAAVQAARAAGHVTAASTGRPWPLAGPAVEAAGGMEYAVCLNGAVVVNCLTGATIATRAMPMQRAIEAAHVARRLLPNVLLAADMADGRHLWEAGFAPEMPEGFAGATVDDPVKLVDGAVLTWLLETPEADVVAMISALRDHLPLGVECRSSGLDMAEIAAHGVTKASSLQLVADLHELDASDAVAFGDGMNDVEMLRWAGHSVAMANAPDAVKAAAGEVARGNDEDGVAIVLESILSGV